MDSYTKTFIICWCLEGLECVIPIDIDLYNLSECQEIANLLTDDNSPIYAKQVGRTIHSLIIRARMNSQRHYEIYVVNTTDSFTKDYLEDLFKTDPQTIVNSIREKGQKIYSDRLDSDVVLIR